MHRPVVLQVEGSWKINGPFVWVFACLTQTEDILPELQVSTSNVIETGACFREVPVILILQKYLEGKRREKSSFWKAEARAAGCQSRLLPFWVTSSCELSKLPALIQPHPLHPEPNHSHNRSFVCECLQQTPGKHQAHVRICFYKSK